MNHKVKLLPGVVEVHLEHGEKPSDIVPVLFDAAKLAREQQLQNLLVISGAGDPATAEAVSLALEEMRALDTPPSRIAFVAHRFPQYSAYHFAERYAEKFGIAAKVHVSLREARDWLGVNASRASA
jgi:hypothetical protein